MTLPISFLSVFVTFAGVISYLSGNYTAVNTFAAAISKTTRSLSRPFVLSNRKFSLGIGFFVHNKESCTLEP